MKECQICKTKETAQWYSGPLCKSCYRREHRKNNLAIYKLKDKAYYQENKSKVLERQKKYYETHIEECKERSKTDYHRRGTLRKDPNYTKRYYEDNKERINKKSAIWQEKNREKVRLNWTNYNKRNPEYRAHMTALRRARKLQATPKWLSSEELQAIGNFYKNCPSGYHVDHIVPLQGESVCGLHILVNLQYLPAKDNIKKGNKF